MAGCHPPGAVGLGGGVLWGATNYLFFYSITNYLLSILLSIICIIIYYLFPTIMSLCLYIIEDLAATTAVYENRERERRWSMWSGLDHQPLSLYRIK